MSWLPPKRFRVLYAKWRTRYVEPAGDWIGRYDERTRKVEIDKALPKNAAGEVFMHELLHIVWCAVGLQRDERLREHGEQIVSAMAPTLFAVLRQNGMLK